MSPPVPRPQICGALLSELTAAAPKRLVRKLDRDPAQAEAWSWAAAAGEVEVTTPRGERVRLRGARLSELEQIACSCLLAPRCLHVLAVASLLELSSGDGEPAESEVTDTDGDAGELEAAAAAERPRLSETQRAAAREAWRAGGELLQSGGASAGALLQAELLRAVHSSRVEGLPRLAASGLRVVRAIRQLRGEAAGAGARELPSALEAWLETAWRLQLSEDPGPEWVGRARRRYGQAGTLRLRGVLSEAIVTATGAGVVTLLVSEESESPAWFSLANVRPGPPSRAEAAYSGPIGIADLATPHCELSRGGLRLTRATASAEGRLGSGQDVRAAPGPGAPWAESLAGAFGVAWEAQLARARASLALPPAERRAGADLLFGSGLVLGREGRALWVTTGERALRLLPPRGPASPGTPSRGERTMGLLARAPGLELSWIARLEAPGATPTLRLLACGVPVGISEAETPEAAVKSPSGTDPAWCLPEDWLGRVNVGLDPLEAHHLGRLAPRAREVAPEPESPSPLRGLERRLERLALGGPGTLAGGAAPALRAEATRLKAAYLPSAAALLLQLADAAHAGERDLSGQLEPPDPEALARAYLAGQLYLGAAKAALG